MKSRIFSNNKDCWSNNIAQRRLQFDKKLAHLNSENWEDNRGKLVSLVAIVMELVVRSEGGQSSGPDAVGEENLRGPVDPWARRH